MQIKPPPTRGSIISTRSRQFSDSAYLLQAPLLQGGTESQVATRNRSDNRPSKQVPPTLIWCVLVCVGDKVHGGVPFDTLQHKFAMCQTGARGGRRCPRCPVLQRRKLALYSRWHAATDGCAWCKGRFELHLMSETYGRYKGCARRGGEAGEPLSKPASSPSTEKEGHNGVAGGNGGDAMIRSVRACVLLGHVMSNKRS